MGGLRPEEIRINYDGWRRSLSLQASALARFNVEVDLLRTLATDGRDQQRTQTYRESTSNFETEPKDTIQISDKLSHATMLPTRLLINASARIGRLAAMSAAHRSPSIIRGASATTCICRIASIRTLDNFPSTTYTATKRKYTSSQFQHMLESADTKSVEPTRLYKEMSPNQHTGQSYESSGASPTEAVHHSAADTTADIISTPSSEYEDYDLDNLEMPISATTSMDYEDNSGCDSLSMDDVMSVREARRVWDVDHEDDAGADIVDDDDAEWYSDGIEGEVSGSGGFVEMEEDWEILHEQVNADEGGSADAQAEEDGDVVIDW